MTKFRYSAAFIRETNERGLPQARRQFTVYAWNRDDAYVAALRELEQLCATLSEDPRTWWFVGSERHK